ncbi:MAG: aminotransferase class I/II-fold pyridoxal phosphate-dependent enzyme [Proteobacteria bacterium]|nr:aminotransferase class I/II-fold pyridoxal phosphate-dependent enzyme [Pseudomonadota bacterium]
MSSLSLPPDEMRALGYAAIDLLVDRLTALRAAPIGRVDQPATLDARLRGPLPSGANAGEVLARVASEVFASALHLDHPRFFGFVPSPGNFVSVIADLLASGFNTFAGTWLEASGPATVELVTLDWLKEMLGLPGECEGLFVSGGSVANLTALAAMRHRVLADRLPGAAVYVSDQTHSSVIRALRLLGFADECVRVLPARDGRMDTTATREAIIADRGAGRRPACIVATAGTTNTGAVDPLRQLAGLSRDYGLWLHVDGAYGAAARLTSRAAVLLDGLELADSWSCDPHKWLFQPYETGCVFVRWPGCLAETFRILPEYLADAASAGGEVNFCDRGPQLTRGFRALKVWMSLQVFGVDAFRAAVDRGLMLAELAERQLRRVADWEVVSPATLGIVAFRCRPQGWTDAQCDVLNARLVQDLVDDGHGFVSSTRIGQRTVLRMCTINPRASDDDVGSTLERLAALAALRIGRHTAADRPHA